MCVVARGERGGELLMGGQDQVISIIYLYCYSIVLVVSARERSQNAELMFV